jgi:hypothetical protein
MSFYELFWEFFDENLKTENGFFEILIEQKTGKHLNNLWKNERGKTL